MSCCCYFKHVFENCIFPFNVAALESQRISLMVFIRGKSNHINLELGFSLGLVFGLALWLGLHLGLVAALLITKRC